MFSTYRNPATVLCNDIKSCINKWITNKNNKKKHFIDIMHCWFSNKFYAYIYTKKVYGFLAIILLHSFNHSFIVEMEWAGYVFPSFIVWVNGYLTTRVVFGCRYRGFLGLLSLRSERNGPRRPGGGHYPTSRSRGTGPGKAPAPCNRKGTPALPGTPLMDLNENQSISLKSAACL